MATTAAGSTRKRAMVVGSMVAVAMVSISPLAGAHGGGTDKVHACVVSGSGTLRIVGPDDTCRSGETPLDWSLSNTIIGRGTITGEGDNLVDGTAIGHLALLTVGLENLADGAVDGTKLSPTLKNGETGATGPKGANDGDGFLHWSHLEGIPDGIADGDDDDGGSKVGQLETKLADGSSQPDDGVEDLVSFSVVKDLTTFSGAGPDGRITGDFIKNGTITALDLAGDAVESSEIKNGTITAVDLAGSDTPGQEVVGAVTSEKIADGTIQARDLAGGAVTIDMLAPDIVDRLTANAGTATTSGEASIAPPAPTATSPTSATFGTVSLTILSGTHKVLVTGQAVIECPTCTDAANQATVQWTLVDGTDPVASVPHHRVKLTVTDRMATLPVSFLVEDAAAGTHTYKLQVSVLPLSTDGVSVSSAGLAAVDLGPVATP